MGEAAIVGKDCLPGELPSFAQEPQVADAASP